MKGTKAKGKKMSSKSECETFSEANFQKEVKESKLPVLVVFEADWSGPCHIMTPILEDLCGNFRGLVKIGMVDIDANVRLAEDYGILNIPSLLFFDNGEIVDHITGSVPKGIIAAKLNDMVPSANK